MGERFIQTTERTAQELLRPVRACPGFYHLLFFSGTSGSDVGVFGRGWVEVSRSVLGSVGSNSRVSRASSGGVAAVWTRGFYSRLVGGWRGLGIFTLKL